MGNKCVSWFSKKQESIALSTAEAEYIAATMACTQAIWMRSELMNLKEEVPLPLTILCDNNSAINLSKHSVQHSRAKHIDISYHFIKDKVEKGEVKLDYVPTAEQIADILTKPLSSEVFATLRLHMGVQPSSSC